MLALAIKWHDVLDLWLFELGMPDLHSYPHREDVSSKVKSMLRL